MRKKQTSQASTGLLPAILLIVFLLVAATATSVLTMEETITIDEQELNQYINEAITEITTYLQIKDVFGQYSFQDETPRITKIAILISPMFSIQLNLSEIQLSLCDGEDLQVFYSDTKANEIQHYSLFKHPLWNNITNNTFSFISTYDKDNSIVNCNYINDHSDMTYLIVKLSKQFTMKKNDELTITVTPPIGIKKTLFLEAPLPMNTIVSLL